MTKAGMNSAIRHRVRSAFTLIELLVVIAIIAALVAILLPSLSAARRLGMRTKCQSNLHDLSSAWQMYLGDNSDQFLHGMNANVNYGGKGGAISVYRKPKPLNQYVNINLETTEAPLFHCPSDAGSQTIADTHYDHFGTSYSPNLLLIGRFPVNVVPGDPCAAVLHTANTLLPDLTSTRCADPTRLVLLGDFGWVYDWDINDTINQSWRHGENRTHNVAFLDGHVAFQPIKKGKYVTSAYLVMPLAGLLSDCVACQGD
jgi:prepilin-type N-terminal cleavage/methylation domain-containing protein/prepilin-type processing-associated H-X9-DG protein